MAATISPLHRVTADRVAAIRSQRVGARVVSQFGPSVIAVTNISDGVNFRWSFALLNEDGRTVNVVDVVRSNPDDFCKEWVLTRYTTDCGNVGCADGMHLPQDDFASLDAAFSAALMLVVETER